MPYRDDTRAPWAAHGVRADDKYNGGATVLIDVPSLKVSNGSLNCVQS